MSIALRHHYRPRGVAAVLFDCRAPEVLLSGPAGTGKSRACLEKLHLMALLNPGMRGLIVRKTAVSLSSSGLVTFRQHVAKESLAAGDVAYYGGSAQEAKSYRYTNGSVIVIGGMDKATKIMSSEYDVVYVQEAIELTEDDWEAITTRLRNGKVSFQQLIADTNPSVPTHWLKARCDRGDTVMLDCRHEDNPVLFDDHGHPTPVGADYISKLDKLTNVRHARLRKGLWVAAEGLIYEDFDPAVHLVDRFPIPGEWTRWWAVDFGYTNPFVLQCWAEDPDGRLYLYRELYASRRTVDQHAADILKAVTKKDGSWSEPRPRAIICDHDAEGRAVLERELGMSTLAANKKVTEGIQAVQARLRPAGDGKPRLFVLRDSLIQRDTELAEAKKPTWLAEELPGYVWDQAPGKPPKEAPVKENDHGCDAMRYLVAHRDGRTRGSIRWL
ncbi:phage terminase large subunit [Nonomuraea sp. NPDC050404]|uniref:phage terminase large subunit n=1 Tax=Nonomuraea sp. NPDC050404 TaxID=3155783 RepID=UPI0033EA29B1